MTALEYARKNIVFWQSSPLQGRWDDSKYPLVRKQLASYDDPFVKTSVHYGPTQSIKSVLAQTVIAYLLDVRRKTVLAVAQTDEDVKDFSQIKLRPWLERIPSLTSTVRSKNNCKYPITDGHWLWPTHELILSGPGMNAQNSKSAPYLVTDEAHLWNVMYPGALAALQDRMGGRWDRREGHFTTGADAGTEIDNLYRIGSMEEWNMRCPACHELFEPLFGDTSREKYNGHTVIAYEERPSIMATLESARIICPHCDKEHADHPRTRADLDEFGDYVVNNPGAERAIKSFRWNAFALRWKRLGDLLSTYLKAVESAKQGNLAPYENWKKKQEVATWTGEFPMIGSSYSGRVYLRSDYKEPTARRICTGDVQEGEKDAGFHLWVGVDEYDPNGDSRRIDYQKISTWAGMREFQQDHHAADRDTAVDCGARAREVFGVCAKYRWLALKSGDDEQFPHEVIQQARGPILRRTTWLPYSETRLESIMGRQLKHAGLFRMRPGTVPPGFCISRLWSKPQIYALFYALKGGQSGKAFDIAKDMPTEYVDQVHSWVPFLENDPKTNAPKKMVWKKTRKDDHAWQCGAMSMIMAMLADCFPLSTDLEPEERKLLHCTT